MRRLEVNSPGDGEPKGSVGSPAGSVCVNTRDVGGRTGVITSPTEPVGLQTLLVCTHTGPVCALCRPVRYANWACVVAVIVCVCGNLACGHAHRPGPRAHRARV